MKSSSSPSPPQEPNQPRADRAFLWQHGPRLVATRDHIPSVIYAHVCAAKPLFLSILFTAIMFFSFTKTSALLLTASSAILALPTKRQDSCDAVHIFLARGWNETYPGRQGKLAGAICYGLDSCGYEDVQFSSLPTDNYCTSVAEGQRNGVAQMTAYAQRCPDSKLVLSGYSQGANVAGDILGGGGGPFGTAPNNCDVEYNVGLDPSTSPGNQVAAALLFGDNRKVPNQTFDYLSGKPYGSNNQRPADQLANLNQFADVARSYCVINDPVCAEEGPGPFIVEDHLNYFDLYSDDAAGWVKTIIGA